MKKIILLFVSLNIIMAGCTGGELKSNKKNVTVSILPIKYFVDRIGGGDFNVTVLVPPGASPESYEPLPSQMKEIATSEAYFHFGLIDFERSLGDGVVAKNPSLNAVMLSENMNIISGDGNGSRRGADPHVWMSPGRMELAALAILKTLGQIIPDSTAKYKTNFEELVYEMDSLDTHIRASLDSLPRREFVIAHPFLTYYAEDYGLEQISIERDGKEPTAGQLVSVLNEIKGHGINTIFYQKGMSGKGAMAVAENAGISTFEADPLEYEWMDNLYHLTYTLTLTMQ